MANLKRLALFFCLCLFVVSCASLNDGRIEQRNYFERCGVELLKGSSFGGELPRNIAKVGNLPKKIYRSGELEARFLPALKKLGIKSIVTVGSLDQETKKIIKQLGIGHKEFDYSSMEMTAPKAKEVANAVLSSSAPVLVHCHAGADRTGLVVAALRIHFGEKRIETLFKEMRTYCHITWPKYKHYRKVLKDLIEDKIIVK